MGVASALSSKRYLFLETHKIFSKMETPDINFIRHRKFTLRILFNIKPSVRETFQQLGIVVSGAALMSAIAGYGALMVGRSVPVALALGTLGSVGGAMKARLKDS